MDKDTWHQPLASMNKQAHEQTHIQGCTIATYMLYTTTAEGTQNVCDRYHIPLLDIGLTSRKLEYPMLLFSLLLLPTCLPQGRSPSRTKVCYPQKPILYRIQSVLLNELMIEKSSLLKCLLGERATTLGMSTGQEVLRPPQSERAGMALLPTAPAHLSLGPWA